MVQRRLRAGTGVELRLSVGREPLQNFRKAAGDRLVTSCRLKPRPAVLTPCTPAENVVGRQEKKKKKKKVVWICKQDMKMQSGKTSREEAM